MDRDALILENVRLVYYIARDYSDRNEPMEDIVGAGFEGLTNAADRFDPGRGVKFSTYAVPMIRGYIQHHLRAVPRNLRVPHNLWEKINRLRRMASSMEGRYGRSPTPAELAAASGMDTDDVMALLLLERKHICVSLSDVSWAQGSEDRELMRAESKAVIADLLRHLAPKERAVIEARRLEELTWKAIAERLDVAPPTAQKIERVAMMKLKRMASAETKEAKSDE